jgi:hypothetical protein
MGAAAADPVVGTCRGATSARADEDGRGPDWPAKPTLAELVVLDVRSGVEQ